MRNPQLYLSGKSPPPYQNYKNELIKPHLKLDMDVSLHSILYMDAITYICSHTLLRKLIHVSTWRVRWLKQPWEIWIYIKRRDNIKHFICYMVAYDNSVHN